MVRVAPAPLDFGWSELRALTDGDYKYIAAPEPELYDLAADPARELGRRPYRELTGRDYLRASACRSVAAGCEGAGTKGLEIGSRPRLR